MTYFEDEIEVMDGVFPVEQEEPREGMICGLNSTSQGERTCSRLLDRLALPARHTCWHRRMKKPNAKRKPSLRGG